MKHFTLLRLVTVAVGLMVTSCANPQPLPTAPTPIPTLIPATMPPPGATAPEALPVSVEFPAAQPSSTAGQDIYKTQCADCHGADGQGVVQDARDFTDSDYLRAAAPLDFFVAVSDGKGVMPAFGETLTTQDRWNVVFYLWSFSIDQQQLAAGKTAFQANCVACHGADGKGTIPQAPSFAQVEFIARSPASTFFNAVTGGKGVMPAWQDRLSAEDRWAAVEYARSFAYQPLGN